MDFVPRRNFARRCFEPRGIVPKELCTRTDYNRRYFVLRWKVPKVKSPEGEKSRRWIVRRWNVCEPTCYPHTNFDSIWQLGLEMTPEPHRSTYPLFSENRALIVRRFLKIVLVTIFAHKIFHKISKLDMWLSDRHAKFQVSAPVRARARSFLRFYVMGSARWPA